MDMAKDKGHWARADMETCNGMKIEKQTGCSVLIVQLDFGNAIK